MCYHSLELPIQAQDLIKHINIPPIFMTFINTSLMENFYLVQRHKIVSEPKHLIMLLSTTFWLG